MTPRLTVAHNPHENCWTIWAHEDGKLRQIAHFVDEKEARAIASGVCYRPKWAQKPVSSDGAT